MKSVEIRHNYSSNLPEKENFLKNGLSATIYDK